MTFDLEQMQLREKIVSAYVEALNTLSIEPIALLFHSDFMFKWIDNWGVKGELRYIGHLCKAMAELKLEGKSLKAKLVWLEAGAYRFPSVKLLPPVDGRIIYPEGWRYDFKHISKYPTNYDEVILYCRVKHGKLFRVICYAKSGLLTYNYEGEKWWRELKESPRGY